MAPKALNKGQGRLIGVVGPSGVGKDSVMESIATACPEVVLARRVITRPANSGGEDFDGVSEDEFEARVQAGAFALHWQAHGLRYGVPSGVDGMLERGQTVLTNLSRGTLLEAQARFSGFTVLSLTAPTRVLAERLAQRGRESSDEIARRLERAGFALPEGLARVIQIDNGGALQDTVARVIKVLSLMTPGLDAPDMTGTSPQNASPRMAVTEMTAPKATEVSK